MWSERVQVMYGYLRETDDSTSINFSAYGKFLPGEKTGFQLLTIGAKFLRVFRVNPYVLIEPGERNEEWQQKTKLECMFSCRLLNKCLSVAVARIPQLPDQDSILMAFDDAKLSIVAINEKERNMQTISLHAFENEYLRDGFNNYFHPPIVRTDPENRCAATLVYGKHIAILPFHENSKRIHSYIIPLKQIDPRLDNVADMVFLDGYYEPTILFLYEPLQTTPGRACVRYDTMCIMGVSVNIVDRQFAVVWQTANLPMDCSTLLPIPKPLGGALVFGSNTVVYLNQAVPPCGIILNSCYDGFTKFPLKDMKSMKMTLDCSTSVYMEDGRIAVGTREGELYLLRLVTSSGGGTVKSLEFSKVWDTSIAYSLTVCAPGHLFVGSRLGDSQLLEYTLLKTTRESAKRQKMEQNQKEVAAELDEEDMELYGGAIEEQQNDDEEQILESLEFRELDRLRNVGPIKSMCVGRPISMSNDLVDAKRRDPVFDIITASGHGKNGSLCVHQRSLRPEIITSSLLEGAEQLWAVGRKENDSHKYLIVSRIRSTLVLELGEELIELEEQLFVTGEPTVAAGELSQGALAVQVTSTSIALVTDGQQMQEVSIDSNFPVVQASIVDPYVAVLTQNGRLLLYELVSDPYVQLQEVDLSTTPFATFTALNDQITSISMYADASEIMQYSEKRANLNEMRDISTIDVKPEKEDKKEAANDDALLYGEDDDFLYGDAAGESDEDVMDHSGKEDSGEHSAKHQNTRKRKRLGHDAIQSGRGGEQSDAVDPRTYSRISHWLVIAHENGRISIHSLPEMELVYQIGRFPNVPELLTDLTAEDEEKERKFKAQQAAKESTSTDEEQLNSEMKKLSERIMEAQIVGMGINQSHPILFAIVDEQVVMYEMFANPNSQAGHLGIAFRKLPHFICLRSSPYLIAEGKRAPFEIAASDGKRYPLIHSFERVSSINNGVMIGGAVPTMLVYGAWGGMQTHQMTIDGSIKAFTPFNNENVLHGFVYMTQQKSELRIARMHPDFDYEMPYPVKKIEVGRTIHSVRYLMNSDVYAVVSSVPKPSNKIWVVMNDDKQEEIHEKDENFVLPAPPKYTLNLFSSQDWNAVPNTEIDFEDMEAVTACEDVALKSESTIAGFETYLAIGTVNNYGEEVLVRGRILLCEVIEVVPEPDQPTSNRKIKVLFDKEQKGPVTGLCAIQGLLLSGMGQKVFIWQFKDNDLMGLSFLDMHYYVYQLHSHRTIALALDARESLSLIRFQEENKAMSVASRDDRKTARPPMASQFMVDGAHLGFLLSDESGNITLFNYAPETPESNGGERLTVRAAINIGTNINAFLRIKGHTALLNLDTKEEKEAAEQRMSTIFASLDGSFGFVRPLTEKAYRRLHFLQTFIGSVSPQIAGLHIKGSRSAKPPQPIVNGRNARNLIDGDVVEQYLNLSLYDKTDLARRLGVGRYHIIDDLMQLRRTAFYY
uniref:Probable cleavage and polyadenylation specificity factor subunit 1 n=1 Tax=Caenorhabditis tropicalis TaxID=1561998 RepID=A0A1I7TQF8_9PELO